MADLPERSRRHLIEALEALIRERLPAEQTGRLLRFVGHYYARIPEELQIHGEPMDLYGAALAHWGHARLRGPEQSLVRIYNPTLETSGWECPHTVVEVVIEDMPFLVDSLRMELNRHGLRVLSIVHPIVPVQRNEAGELTDVPEYTRNSCDEAFIHLEVERRTDRGLLQRLQSDLGTE